MQSIETDPTFLSYPLHSIILTDKKSPAIPVVIIAILLTLFAIINLYRIALTIIDRSDESNFLKGGQVKAFLVTPNL